MSQLISVVVVCSVLDPEAVPVGGEADPGGGHVPRELLLPEGGAAQQARDRDPGVARKSDQLANGLCCSG